MKNESRRVINWVLEFGSHTHHRSFYLAIFTWKLTHGYIDIIISFNYHNSWYSSISGKHINENTHEKKRTRTSCEHLLRVFIHVKCTHASQFYFTCNNVKRSYYPCLVRWHSKSNFNTVSSSFPVTSSQIKNHRERYYAMKHYQYSKNLLNVIFFCCIKKK